MSKEYRGSKKHPFHVSCGGVVYQITPDGQKEILLLHRFKTKSWAYDSWHLPKGTQRVNETETETAQREILEEAGFQVKVLDKLGSLESEYFLDGAKINKTTHYFLCAPVKKIGEVGSEHDEVVWKGIDEAISLVEKFPLYEKEAKILQKFKDKKF
ncbi:NUDIX domain-containing protein [Patescibacteria group bacterium]|nr:NUDIX domain-containing protein [Patescibacteria group bacterium]MCL5409698.1 NUDIX domain-containing protein [Patescibacteria group bacterium]